MNDAPVIVAPARASGNQDTAVPIPGLSVQDIDAQSGQLKVELGVSYGTLTLGTKAGLTFEHTQESRELTVTRWQI